MQTDASMFTFWGIQIYAYGLYLMAGTLLFAGLIWILAKRDRVQDAALLGTAIGLPLALVFSRGLYCLADSNFYAVASLKNALSITSGGMSMFGALAGMLLGLALASWLTMSKLSSLLDAFAPSAMAFIALARLGERHTALGISRPLVTGLLNNTFLAYSDTYDAYLKTWLLEAIAAALLCLVLVLIRSKAKRKGDTFLLWMLLFGASQTILESLRYDGHMRFSFIGLQQVLSAFLFGIAIIVFSLRCMKQGGKGKLPVIALVLLGITVAAAIGLEFLIDRSAINKALLYLVYIVVMAVPAGLAIHMQKGCSHGQSKN